MVRLKHKNNKKLAQFGVNLNSTMVRLKLNKEQQFTVTIKESQFHYGSIKTLSGGV